VITMHLSLCIPGSSLALRGGGGGGGRGGGDEQAVDQHSPKELGGEGGGEGGRVKGD